MVSLGRLKPRPGGAGLRAVLQPQDDGDLLLMAAAPVCLDAGLAGEPLYGMVPQAGLPKGFRYARASA